MAYLQIRDVPDDVRDVLAERARENGQSLNMFLREVVLREASFTRNRALVDETAGWPGRGDFTVDDVLEALDEGRAGAR
ncbi:FitA-like ribbon-helix-helix domain-containing protein [Isoptericola sp. BMS4]|uniref:FitA-like ribbon-helix-helix domain-containing protein n=1 Tax=Isoptericola sp. BMS4 TaxID=2527875 RepID=UPI00196A2F4F|nr:Arc family DNA-binding protein [Isoptericola sp. BMS4]